MTAHSKMIEYLIDTNIFIKYLTRFELIHFDESVSRKTIELIRIYSKGHGLMFGDAIIAATCLENDLTLLTFNIKDFRFIKNLKILKP